MGALCPSARVGVCVCTSLCVCLGVSIPHPGAAALWKVLTQYWEWPNGGRDTALAVRHFRPRLPLLGFGASPHETVHGRSWDDGGAGPGGAPGAVWMPRAYPPPPRPQFLHL